MEQSSNERLALAKLDEAERHLARALRGRNKRELEKLLDAQGDLICESAAGAFKEGFALGAKIMLSILKN